MIDIEYELKRMTKEFGLDEKKVAQNFRTNVRNMWSDSLFKTSIYDQRMEMIDNTNVMSKKRFPKIQRWKCGLCGRYFSKGDTELDHIEDELSMKELSDSEGFIRGIFFTTPDNLQILCKDQYEKVSYTDAKGKVKKKKVFKEFGCHTIKTHASRYGYTLEYARKHKHFLLIAKSPELLLDTLKQYGVESIPTTAIGKKRLLEELMFAEGG